MTKKLLRNMMIGFCVFITTIIIAYITFMYVYKFSAEKATEALSFTDTAANAVETPVRDKSTAAAADYYIAKFDGKNLSVYAHSGGSDKFLYNLDVRIEDISDTELKKLSEGILLADKKALASFEEDFTS